MNDETTPAANDATVEPEGPPAGPPRPFAPLQVRDPARYQVIGEHGRGGIGRVVRATDREFGRDVAVKELLRPTAQSETRFFREALLTARLEHPNIVPVHEAGRWPDGTPFYVMKLVAGRPLRALIDDARTTEDRVALLDRVLAVADAVAYAHDRGVIHRDLKPSNIMAGDYGETVVIDWGLAKRLDESDDGLSADGTASPLSPNLTAEGAVMGTPAYMAPEQASGGAADARSDVYALGAILNDVLGRPARRAASRGAAPARDGDREIAADLISIVARAMARAPADRYPSARAFADDLRRFRTGRLVSAHTYSLGERVRRFVARHRAAVAVGAAALVALVAVSAILVSRIVAERDSADAQRRRAETNRGAAEELVGYMNERLRDRLEAFGRLDILGDLGQRVEAYYQSVAATSTLDVDQRRRRAEAQLLAGDVAQATGDGSGAEPFYHRAAALLADVESLGDARSLRTLARVALGLSQTAYGRGDLDAALREATRVIQLLDRAAAITPEDAATGRYRIEAIADRGNVFRKRGQWDDATRAYEDGIRFARAHPAAADDVVGQTAVADLQTRIARMEETRGRWQEALPHALAAVAEARPIVARAPKDTRILDLLADAISLGGNAQSRLGRLDEASASFEEAIAVDDQLVALEPTQLTFRRGQVGINRLLGELEEKRGRIDAARRAFQRSIAAGEDLIRDRPGTSLDQRHLVLTYTHVADLERKSGHADVAITYLRRGVALASAVAAREPDNALAQEELANALRLLGLAVADRAPDEARADLEQALTAYEALQRAGKLGDAMVPLVPQIRQALATYRATGRFPSATPDQPRR